MKKLLENWNRFINEAPQTRYELGYEDGQMARAKELER